MEKIKVLQLVEDLKRGGAERVIADISLGINKSRYDVSIWCISKGGAIAEELQEMGASLRILGISSYFNPFNILRLGRLLRKEKPDIIHTHGYFASVIGRTAAKLININRTILINHVHSTYWDYKKRNLWIEKFLSKSTHKIICCSNAVRRFVIDHEHIDPSLSVVIYNGVDIDKFSCTEDTILKETTLGFNPAKQVIGTVSSLTAHKGHIYLLKAASKVLEVFPSTQFIFVGDGRKREELEKKAKELNVFSSITFLGTRKDIPNILAAIDIFVLPSSSREGLGISLLEAMAAEKPVVATSIGGIPEVVIDEETGILVPPKKANDIADAIIELLKSPIKAKTMGQKGALRAKEKFTTQHMLVEIEKLYEVFIQKKR